MYSLYLKISLFPLNLWAVSLPLIISASALAVVLVLAAALIIFKITRKKKTLSALPTALWLDNYITGLSDTATTKTMFYLYRIDFVDGDSIVKKTGAESFDKNIADFCDGLLKILPGGAVLTYRSFKSIVAFAHSDRNPHPQELAMRIVKSAEGHIKKTRMQTEINVSAAVYPANGQNSDSLLTSLDTAMVSSRRNGPGSYAFYTLQDSSAPYAGYNYYKDISSAIETREFTLYYQPIVDAETMKTVAAESLIRWKHRKLGILPPVNFLHIMEQTGDINWAGFWCFEELIKQENIWFSNYPSFSVGLNLSEKQLSNPRLVEKFKELVKKYKANPGNITLEINCKVLLNVSEETKKNIISLQKFGFMIACDGLDNHVNIEEVKNLNLDVIKLEASLWKKAAVSNVASAITDLIGYCALNQKMLVTLGVENKEEYDMLRAIGITYMQGYVFTKPAEPQFFINSVLDTPWKKYLS